jgi:hypothetical protein
MQMMLLVTAIDLVTSIDENSNSNRIFKADDAVWLLLT